MAGLFDDLEPQAAAPGSQVSGGGLFDDLEAAVQPPTTVPHAGVNSWLPESLQGIANRMDDVGTGVEKGMIGAAEGVVGIGNILSGGALGNLLEQHAGWDPEAAKQKAESFATPEYQAAQQELKQARGFTDTLRALAANPSTIVDALAQSAPSMMLGGVVGRGVGAGAQLLGKSAGLLAPAIGEGVVAAGQAAEQTRQATGDLTLGGTALAIGTGAATGLLGAAGAKLGRAFGIADIDAQLSGQRGAEVAAGLVRRVLGGAGIEGVEELSQSAQEQVLGNIAAGRDPMANVGQASALGLATGGVMGGAAGVRRPQVAGQPVQAPADPLAQQAPVSPLAEPLQQTATTARPTAPAPLQQPAQAPQAVSFAGSQDVRPLFESMGMGQEQMAKSLDLLAPVEADIETQRRGVQSWEETGRLAALTGTTIEQLKKHRAGVLFNAEEQVAATRLLRDATTRTLDLADRVQKGLATELDQANFLQALADMRTTQRAVMASRAEIGRAMNVMRADVTTMKEASRILESAGGQQGAKAIADALTTAARVGGVEAANKMARASGTDLFWTAYKSALLSSPDTHFVNLASNLFTAAMNVPTRAVAGAIGTAKRLATGGRAGETQLAEPIYQLAGAVEGAVNGVRGAVESWRTGQDAFGIDANKFEGHRQDLPGQKVWGVPLRLLQSEDAFFKFLNDGMERYSVAYRMASQELKGQGPAAVHQRVQELIANPPPALVEAGEDAALFQTFNNQAGKITAAVNNLRHSLPWGTGNLVVPFLRTPANLITFAVKHSPAAPLFKEIRSDLRAGGAKQETALARMGIGSMLIGLGAVGAMGGALTGGGPADEKERRAWLAAGNQPYSLKINGRWYDYSRIEPFASLVGIASDVATGAQDQAAGFADLIKAIGRNFTSKTWLQGLSGVMQALTDPDRYGERWVLRSGATLLQPWTALSHLGRYGDPVQRRTDSFLDQLRYRLPGETIGREGLLPRLDDYGQPLMEQDRQVGRAGPFKHIEAGADPVREEAGRLGWAPPKLEAEFNSGGRKFKLTPEQHNEFQQLTGQILLVRASKLVASPGWQKLDDDQRRAALSKSRDVARDAVKMALLPLLVKGDRRALDALQARTDEALRQLTPRN